MRGTARAAALVVFATALLVGARQFQDPFDRSAGLIGLVPLPEVFGESACVPFKPKPIALYASADSPTPVGEIRVTKPWTLPPEGGCEGLEVRVFRNGASESEELPTLEYGYEEQAAIVLARSGARVQIVLATGAAWIAPTDVARYLPAEQLLAEGLTYLREGAAAQLRRSPALDAPRLSVTLGDDQEPLVTVIESRTIAGALWVRVTLLEENECLGEPTGLRPDTAWVPFHGADRRPTVWFFSRGC